MESFVRDRFMLWVPPPQHSVLRLCSQWQQMLATQTAGSANSEWRRLGLLEPIRNGGNQLRCRASHPLFAPTVAAMREAVDIFIGKRVSSALHCAGLIMLTMEPGDGPMPYHADQPNDTQQHRLKACKCWSVLMYTSDCQATALPRMTEEQMDMVVDPDTPASALTHLLKSDNFFAGRVRSGSTVVMRSDVPHASVKHRGSDSRLVLYALFSPQAHEQQLTHAHFPFGVHE